MSLDALDARSLRHFIAVARTGSIRGAAEFLRVVPSAVSRQVAEVEHRLGLLLFDRTARGVRLTEAGSLVLEHARRVVEDLELLAEQLDHLKDFKSGHVRIGCGEGFIPDLVANGLRAFHAVHPEIRSRVTIGNTRWVMDAVLNGDVDVGVAYNPVLDAGIRSLAISRQPLCYVAASGNRLLQRPSLRLDECLADPIVLLVEESAVRQTLGRVAADCGLALAPMVEASSIDVLRRAVEAGLGATFLPAFAVTSEVSRGTLGVVELEDVLLREASAHLFIRARRRLPVSVERLAESLSREMVAFSPTGMSVPA